MRIILFLVLSISYLFSLVLDSRYVVSPNTLSSLVNGANIYRYIEKNPKLLKKLPKKSIFDFSKIGSIKAKNISSYDSFYIFDNQDEDFIYIKIPARLLGNEFNLLEYKTLVGTNKNKYYILRFKKTFKKDNLTYLKLDIGKKKEFTLKFNSSEIKEFVKNHSNLLFQKPDLFDSLTISDDKIVFTSNYTRKSFKVNFYLQDFIKITNKKILSKKIERTFILQLDNNLPSLFCNGENLLESIFIGNEEFTLQEEVSTSNLYSLYILSNQDLFIDYLSDKLDFIKMSSLLKNNIHTISYRYKTRDVNIKLNLPKNISDDIESKYISSFNNFKFQINGTTFSGYINGKKTYKIQRHICDEDLNRLDIVNIKNYSEYKKWDTKINIDNNSITFTPKFNIYKISPIIYAPFLLKKQNKYVVNSMIDEESLMDGEVKYAYVDNNTRFQSKDNVSPKTNTNIYFKYPKDTNIKDIVKKTKFIYNSNPVQVVSSQENTIKFTASSANKIALVYFPTGNLNSFRKYFLRYFDCSQENVLEEETCFNYLADMENGVNVFFQNLRKSKKYSQIVYRKHVYKESNKQNLISINKSNRIYDQASDEEVLGKTYDRYGWDINQALEYDKIIFSKYGLKNIDLIYFSNIESTDRQSLSKLNNMGFNKVFLVNFGHKLPNFMSEFENITYIKHRYLKHMNFGMKEFDLAVFQELLQQLK